MASIQKVKRKDGTGVFRVQVCINGIRDSTTKASRSEAKIWAAERTAQFLGSDSLPTKSTPPNKNAVPLTVSDVPAAPARTLGDVFERYSREVSPTKIGFRWERIRLISFSKSPLAETPLQELGPQHLAAWRDERLKQVSGSTVRREMTLFGAALEICRREWRWITTNPARDVRKPSDAPHRKQRISNEDLKQLLTALKYIPGSIPENKTQEVAVCLLLAIETACRSGELLSLARQHVHLKESYIHLPVTKNGSSRDVPLSTGAIELLELMLQCPARPDGKLFSVTLASKDALFRKAKNKADLKHIHFHDSRREATTRLSEIFNPLELSRITGHKDLKMLLTYYQKSATELAQKMEKKS